VLSNEFYVDDLISGASNIEEATKIQQELSSLLKTAGLTLSRHPPLNILEHHCKGASRNPANIFSGE